MEEIFPLVDADGNVLEKSYSYDEDVQKFHAWLNSGLARFAAK